MRTLPAFVLSLSLLACNQGGDAKPADAKPADAKPTDAKPADAKPADAKPADAKPGDAAPAPGPADLKLVDVHDFIDKGTGYVKIFGAVKNEGSQWYQSVRIRVLLLGADGKPLSVGGITAGVKEDLGIDDVADFTYLDTFFLAPGSTAYFSYLRDPAKIGGAYARSDLSLSATPSEAGPVVEATLKSSEKVDDERYKIAGTFTNKGSVGCRSPKVQCIFTGDDGKITTVDLRYMDDYFQKILEPGKSADFLFEPVNAEGGSKLSLAAVCDAPE